MMSYTVLPVDEPAVSGTCRVPSRLYKGFTKQVYQIGLTLKYYLLACVLMSIFKIVESYYYNLVITDGQGYILYWTLFTIIQNIIRLMIVEDMSRYVSTGVGNSFEKHTLEEYSKLNQQTKFTEPITLYTVKMNQVSRAYRTCAGWGSFMVFQLIETIGSSVVAFINYPVAALLSIVVLSIASIYMRINLKIAHERREVIRKERTELDAEINLLWPRFEAGYVGVDTIYEKIEARNNLDLEISLQGSKIWTTFTFSTILVQIIISYLKHNEIQMLIVLVGASASFTSAFGCAYNFYRQYSVLETDYKTYHEFWEDNHVNQLPPVAQYPVPQEIVVTSVDYKVKDSTMSLSSPLRIPRGSFVVLCGESGCGKSRFIAAFNGDMPGAYLDANVPGSYASSTAICLQSIKEKMKIGGATIRQVFGGLGDVEIWDACRLAECADWVESIITHSAESNGLDTVIKTQPSGGELERLALATILSQDKEILFLDEPEQGSDPDRAYRILDNIRYRFRDPRYKDRIVFLVCHLENVLERLKDDLTLIIKFDSDTIRPVKPRFKPVTTTRYILED